MSRINDLAEYLGIPASTIRYYEKAGLFHLTRSENGYRDISQDELQTLMECMKFRQLGFTTEDVAAITRNPPFEDTAAAFWALLDRLGQELEEKRAQLNAARRYYASIEAAPYNVGKYWAVQLPARRCKKIGKLQRDDTYELCVVDFSEQTDREWIFSFPYSNHARFFLNLDDILNDYYFGRWWTSST